MGVDILSRQVTLSERISSECATRSQANVTTRNTNSVRRSLFGPVDHQETMSFCQKELAKVEAEKRLKWNFDFANERPLKGNFKWEKVEKIKPCSKSVVLLVKSPTKVTRCKTKRSPLKSRVNGDNVNVRNSNKQTTITEYIHISKSIAKQRVEKDTLSNSKK